MNTPNNIQVSNGKLLIQFDSGLATGWREGPALLNRAPIARPKIKMPLHVWRQALSFLVDVFDHVKIEAQVLFYYNKEEEDFTLFVPHQYGSGASTNTFECTENTETFEILAADGYDYVGSVHSHCTMSAFQSGTDKDDEFGNNDGFHITIGKMNDDVMDIHCRSVITILGDPDAGTKGERLQVPFFLEEFIEGLPDFDKMGNPPPSRIRKEWTKHIIANREELDEYPKEWEDRINTSDPTKKKYVTYPQPNGNANTVSGGKFYVQGIEHKLVDGKLIPCDIKRDSHEDNKQWWHYREEQERRLLAQIAAEEEADELEAEELRKKQEAEETDRLIAEQGAIFGHSL